MKGKGSRLAILLATVLTFVGAFGVTALATDLSPNADVQDVTMTEGYYQKKGITPGDIVNPTKTRQGDNEVTITYEPSQLRIVDKDAPGAEDRPLDAAWFGTYFYAPEGATDSGKITVETSFMGEQQFDVLELSGRKYFKYWLGVKKSSVESFIAQGGVKTFDFTCTWQGQNDTTTTTKYHVVIDLRNVDLLGKDDAATREIRTKGGEIVNTVTFNKNDDVATGKMEEQTVPTGDAITLSKNTFKLTGKAFVGWATSATGPVKYDDGEKISHVTEDMELFAVWKDHIHDWKIGVKAGTTNTANIKCKAEGCPYNTPKEALYVVKVEASSHTTTGTAVPAKITTNTDLPEEINVSNILYYEKDGEGWKELGYNVPVDAGDYKAVAEVVPDGSDDKTTIYAEYSIIHEHAFSMVYNGKGDTDKSRVGVICENPGCDILPESKNVKIKLDGGATKTYNGQPVEARITKTDGTPADVQVTDIEYAKYDEETGEWDEASTAAPIAVGHYKASAEVSIDNVKETIEVEFTINPCEHEWTVKYNEDHSVATVTCSECGDSFDMSLTAESPVIYNGEYHKAATLDDSEVPEGLTTQNSKGVKVLYYKGDATTGGTNVGVKIPGNFYARARLYPADEDGNKQAGSTAIAEIEVPIKVLPAVTVAAKEGLVYGDNQPLVTTTWSPSKHTGYTIKYAVDNTKGETFDTIPINVDYSAGTHPVFYNVYDSENKVVEALSGQVDVTIAKKTIKVTAPTAKNPTFSGDTQKLINEGNLDDTNAVLKYAISETKPEEASAYVDASEIVQRDAGLYYVWYEAFDKEGKVLSRDNYQFVDAKSEETVVLPAPVEARIYRLEVVIRAVDTSKDEGEDDPEFDYTVMTDAEEPVDVTKIFKADVPSYYVYRYYDFGENPGTYRIDEDDYDIDDKLIRNYSISFDDEGKLTIKATDAYPVGLTQTYNSEEQPLVAVGEQGDGTSFVYVVNPAEGTNPDDWEYTTEIPKATDAGVYNVYYAVAKNGKKIGQWKKPENQPEIRKAPIRINARGYKGVYDGEYHPAVVTVDGIYEADKSKEDEIAIYYSQTEPIDEHNWQGQTKKPVQIKNVGEKTAYYFARFKNSNTLSDNYEIVGEAGGSVDLVVTASPLMVLVDDETITYGEAYEPTEDDYAVIGLIEDPHHIHVTLTAQDDDETPYEPGMDVGMYDIVATVTGSSDVIKNYDVNVWDGTLTVVKKDLKITADDKEIPYNTSAKGLTVSYDGLIDSDVKDKTAEKKEPKDGVIGGMQRVSAPDYSKGEDVGEYDIIPSDFTSKNYEIELAKGTLTVTPLGVAIGWNYDPEDPFVYNGEEYTVTPYLEGGVSILDIPYVDVENADGDNITYSATDAGTYTAKAKLTGTAAGNYTIAEGQDTVTWSIAPRKAWVEWTATSFTYDGKEHAVGYELKNVVEGEKFKATIKNDKATNAATYVAEISKFSPANDGTKENNYRFYTDASKTQEIKDPITANTRWTISRAEATIKANDNTIYYGYAPSDAGYTPSGVVKGDNIGTVSYAFSYTQNGKPGAYEIKPVLSGENPNYVVKVETGKLTVLDNVTTLVAQGKASGKKAVNVSWNGVTNAASYDVYLAKCNSKHRKSTPSLKGSTSGNSLKVSGLKKGTCYKYYVVAKNASGNVIAQSTTGHFIAGNVSGKKTNARSITASSGTVTLNKGGSYTLSTSQSKAKKGKKYKLLSGGHAALTRYISSNTAVATVDSNGVIRGVGGGYCKVYALAVNGMWAEVEVYVN